jgi:hypothetical protein
MLLLCAYERCVLALRAYELACVCLACVNTLLQFAMFARVSAFDWLLLKPLRRCDPPALHLLQAHLRFAVGQVILSTINHY